MNLVALSSCTVKTETHDPRRLDCEIQYIDVGSVDRERKEITDAKVIQASGAPSRARKLVQEGDVLVSNVRPNLNAVALVGPELDGATASTGFSVLRANEQANNRYLFYRLISQHFVDDMVAQATGASYPAVSEAIVLSHKIPLPPLKEQQRIVEILDQADALRQQRRKADELSQRIIPAIFHEMFGDPRSPRGEWPTSAIGDLCNKFSDGPFGSNLKTSHYSDSGVRVIRLQNIGLGKFVDRDRAFISETHFQTIKRHECNPRDVLIGTMGEPNLRACIQPLNVERAINKADCVQARVDPQKATPEFLCWLLNHPTTLQLVPGAVQGQTRGRVSMGRIREAIVVKPPLALQEKFSLAVSEISGAFAKSVVSKAELETLFQTLLHRAFDGSLTASWREAHAGELLQEMEQQS